MPAYTQKHCRFGITQKSVIYHFTYLSTGDNEEADNEEADNGKVYDVTVAISADGRHVVSLMFNAKSSSIKVSYKGQKTRLLTNKPSPIILGFVSKTSAALLRRSGFRGHQISHANNLKWSKNSKLI